MRSYFVDEGERKTKAVFGSCIFAAPWLEAPNAIANALEALVNLVGEPRLLDVGEARVSEKLVADVARKGSDTSAKSHFGARP